ncbi:MAG: hypothetical protein F6K55_42555 [Moorea sp. SIO4A3]|nr:hypothetical protein [Moorena sp. SIO4A3]
MLGATLPGQGTDESQYLPTWINLAEIIGHKNFLFLADSKASSWANRAKIDTEGGIYVFPLAMTKPRPKILFDWQTYRQQRLEKLPSKMPKKLTQLVTVPWPYATIGI